MIGCSRMRQVVARHPGGCALRLTLVLKNPWLGFFSVRPPGTIDANVAIEWKGCFGSIDFQGLSPVVVTGMGMGANGWRQYRAFFVWLVQTVVRLDSDDQSPPASSAAAAAPPDVMAVAQFLTHQLSSDRLAPHLAQTPLGPPEPRTPARGEGGVGAGEGATTGVNVGVGRDEGSSLEAVLAFVAHAEGSDKDAQAPAADGWCLRPEVNLTPPPSSLMTRLGIPFHVHRCHTSLLPRLRRAYSQCGGEGVGRGCGCVNPAGAAAPAVQGGVPTDAGGGVAHATHTGGGAVGCGARSPPTCGPCCVA